VLARNHQVLGVNNAVASVGATGTAQAAVSPEKRLRYRVVELPKDQVVDADLLPVAQTIEDEKSKKMLSLVDPPNADLGKLGVFWHTQGSGKSYSMAFFAEKVPAADICQVHVPADDRPQRPR